ncbi:unnamed protein product [Larinioides sclopetarius]|uniref:BED-type domain-containing protein n=1 Tax=Larinioides sclopetarius TaxID=280406 RepID=A0AAV1ZQ74_9ARAC
MAEEDSDMDDVAMTEDDPNDSDYEQEKLTLKAKKIKRGSNGKWKLYYDSRCFKKEWIDLFPWVEEDPDDPKFAICRACNKKIKAHKGILDTHQKTKKHLRNLSGSDDIEEDGDDDPKKTERTTDPKTYNGTTTQPLVEQLESFLLSSQVVGAVLSNRNGTVFGDLVEIFVDKQTF